MAQPLGGYVGSGHDDTRASASMKARSVMFARSDQAKKAIAQETAEYRLKETTDKFAASSSTAADTALQQATVGLVTKEEFARRREALETEHATAREAAVSGQEVTAEVKPKGKKKKREKKTGGLSFTLEDEDEDDDAARPNDEKKLKSSA